MCSHGAIPPFNPFIGTFLRQLSIAPSQLHPNGYAILLGLCMLFSRTLNHLPSFEEIRFLCTFGKGKDHPSIVNIRGARNRRLIFDLPETAHGFLNQYFYVRCPASFYSIWREGGEIAYLHLIHFESLSSSDILSANFIPLCSYTISFPKLFCPQIDFRKTKGS